MTTTSMSVRNILARTPVFVSTNQALIDASAAMDLLEIRAENTWTIANRITVRMLQRVKA